MDTEKYYVYILKSEKDNKLYTGSTAWLEFRVKQHNDGLVKSTRHRRPLKLIYYEAFEGKQLAQKREKFLKSGQGRNFLKAKLNVAT
jgi:putative endonuclease